TTWGLLYHTPETPIMARRILMIHRWSVIVLVAALGMGAAGCATSGQMDEVNRRLDDLSSRVDEANRRSDAAEKRAIAAEKEATEAVRQAELAADKADAAARTSEAIFKK